jgi:hypothetical protein
MASVGLVHTKFHEELYRRSTILKFYFSIVRGCDVGITDGEDFISTTLRWSQGHDIHTKFHEDRCRLSIIVKGVYIYTHTYTHTDSKEIS